MTREQIGLLIELIELHAINTKTDDQKERISGIVFELVESAEYLR